MDPFRYVKLASLSMAIFRRCFLPDESIVADNKKSISKTCKEWMVYMNEPNLIPEVLMKIDRAKFDTDAYDKSIHCGKCLINLHKDTNTYYKYDEHMFTHVYSWWLRSEKQNNHRVQWLLLPRLPKMFPWVQGKIQQDHGKNTHLLELAG